MAKITEIKPTHKVFTYEVKLIIQVLGDEEEAAKKKLDAEGGFVSNREVTLLKTAPLYNEFSLGK
jgi:hypothetical protein